MRVLLACEESGACREAFRALGHDAWSCDLVPARDGSPFHVQADAHSVMCEGWDVMIAFPPCTYLAVSGLHWNHRRPGRAALTLDAIAFAETLWHAPIERVAIENPIGVLSTRSALGRPTQVIHPWQFGHNAAKATCLWLRGLTPLVPALPLPGDRRTRRRNQTASGQNKLGPSPTRARDRAQTYAGIAAAMAAQWGGYAPETR